MQHHGLPSRSSSAKRTQSYSATLSHTSSCLAEASEQNNPSKRRLLLPEAQTTALAATLPAHGRYVLPNLRSGGLAGHPVEDAWECRPNVLAHDNRSLQSGQEPLALFGVYDGHCGASVSKLCVARLHQHLRTQLREAGAASSSSRLVQVMPSALRAAFVQTDAEARRVPGSGSGGSTATVAVVSSTHIWVAYCGDSRAVIGSGARLVETSDQKASREDERARIEGVGGCVLHYQGALRVMGVLACTRAIGDHDLEGYGVTAEPEVLTWERHSSDECLILASDGLWDKVGSQEAVEVIRRVKERCSAHPNASLPPSDKRACASCSISRAAAQALAKCARGRNSRDDITVCVVNLDAPCSCLRLVGAHNTSTSSLAAAAGSGCAAAAAAARARSLQANGSLAAPGSEAGAGGDAHVLQQLQQQLLLPATCTAGVPPTASTDVDMLSDGVATPLGAAGAGQGLPHTAGAGVAAADSTSAAMKAFPGTPAAPAAAVGSIGAPKGWCKAHAPSQRPPAGAAAGGGGGVSGKGEEYVDDMRCTPPPGCSLMPRGASPGTLGTASNTRGYLPGALTVPRSPTPTTSSFMRLPKALSGGLGPGVGGGKGARSSAAAAAGTGLCMFGQVSAAAAGELRAVSRQLQASTPGAAVADALGVEPILPESTSSSSRWPSPLGPRPAAPFAALAASGAVVPGGVRQPGSWIAAAASEGQAGALGQVSPQQRLPSSSSAPPSSAVLSPFGLVSYGLAPADCQLPPPAMSLWVPQAAAAMEQPNASGGVVLASTAGMQQPLAPSLSVQQMANGVSMPLLPVASSSQLPLQPPGDAVDMAFVLQQQQAGVPTLLCTDASAAAAGGASGAADRAGGWSVPDVVVPPTTNSLVTLVPTPPNMGGRHSSVGRSPSCGLSAAPGDAPEGRATSCDVPMLVTSS